MKPDKLRKLLERHQATLSEWSRRLDAYSAEAFGRRVPESDWSPAQVYDHVRATQDRLLANALQCARGEGARKPVAIGPALMCAFGSFPPVRIRVRKIPAGLEALYAPKTVTKEEAARALEHMRAQLPETMPAVAAASPAVRVRHWAGGWFNASQWFQSAEMHLRHHLRQLDRMAKPSANGRKG